MTGPGAAPGGRGGPMKVEMSPEEAASMRREIYSAGKRDGYAEAARKARASSRWGEPELAVLRLAVDAARGEGPSRALDELAMALVEGRQSDGVVVLDGVDTSVRDAVRRCAESLKSEGRVLPWAG